MRRVIGAIGLCLLLAAGAACGSSGGGSHHAITTSTTRPPGEVQENLVPSVSYQLDPAAEQRRYQALLAALRALPGGAGVTPTHDGGNFVTASVCTPAGAACQATQQRGVSLSAPGQDREVTTYTDNGPTFGEGFSATTVPTGARQLAVEVDYREAQGDLVGPGFSLTLVWLTPALLAQIRDVTPTSYFDLSSLPPAVTRGQEVTISDAPTYATDSVTNRPAGGVEATIGIGADAPTLIGALEPYLASPTGFATHADERFGQLLAAVTAALRSGKVSQPTTCHRVGDGAPTCRTGPLSATVQAALQKQADADIAADRAFVAAHGPAMYQAMRAAMLLPGCQACWS